MLKIVTGGCAVIVETRYLHNLATIIHSHMKMLGKSWCLIIFHGNKNKEYIYEHFPYAVKKELNGRFDKGAYNDLLTSCSFWEQIPCEKILIFQYDSMLLRRGIDEFLKWDYIGAPWNDKAFGGNGGLSLRSKTAMIDTIKNSPPRRCINEDAFFVKNLVRLGKAVAPSKVGRKFSCEMSPMFGTLGCHAIEKHAGRSAAVKYKNQYKKTIKYQ